MDMWSVGCIFGELLQRVVWIGHASTPHLQVGWRVGWLLFGWLLADLQSEGVLLLQHVVWIGHAWTLHLALGR
jgi:hypothetical protein